MIRIPTIQSLPTCAFPEAMPFFKQPLKRNVPALEYHFRQNLLQSKELLGDDRLPQFPLDSAIYVALPLHIQICSNATTNH
jgi:hypothetical protein